MTTLPEKINLSDDERSRIRWSSTKQGFVVRTEFDRHWTRRGMHEVRPLRSQAFTTEIEARRHAGDQRGRPYFIGRIPATIAEVQILRVDALGNVQDLIEVL